MNLALMLIILSLAIYRVATDLAWEDGPANIYGRWRDYMGQNTWVGRGFHCPICLSFWLGFLAALALPWYGWLWYVALALSLSAPTAIAARR